METYNLYERNGDVWEKLQNKPKWVRWCVYYFIIISILFLSPFTRVDNFIYFQF